MKLTAKPKVMENLKRSWKNSWKVLEFEELKRVQTLFLSNKQYKECLQLFFLKQIFVYFEDVAVHVSVKVKVTP